MTLKELIEQVDSIKPNAYTEEQKTVWVNNVEGMVQSQIFLLAPEEMISYKWPDDQDKELLVTFPHEKLYPSYLCAYIDYANGEYNKYQNTMQMFNADFSEFMRWFANTYRPADTWTQEDGYGLLPGEI
jgi:hypothetical protein